jgi:hypothetical protein
MASLPKLKVASKRGLADAALYRLSLGGEIAARLQDAATLENDAEILADADMMAAASTPERIWFGSGLSDAAGASYEGYGSLIVPASRANPAYMKVSATRARKRMLAAFKTHRPLVGEAQRFITFTIPPLFGFDLVRAFQLLDGALVLLKKRKFFKFMVSAAVFGDEVTTGARITHFHCHSHMLAWTRKFSKKDIHELRRCWTQALQASARKLGVANLPINSKDGLAVANVKQVVPRERDGRTITLEKAIAETCKYTVKGTEFTKMPDRFLCQFARALRGRQMITLFGDINNRKGKQKRAQYLDLTHTNDGETSVQVQDSGAENGTETARQEGWREFRSIRKRRVERKEPLRLVGARMIAAGKRQEWLEILEKEFTRRTSWRKRQLATRFPYATFSTLAGEVWYGVELQGDETHLTLAN